MVKYERHFLVCTLLEVWVLCQFNLILMNKVMNERIIGQQLMKKGNTRNIIPLVRREGGKEGRCDKDGKESVREGNGREKRG